MSGGTTTTFPGPSAEETSLMREQLDLLKQQRQEIEDFKPFVLKQYGLENKDIQVENPVAANLRHRLTELQNEPTEVGKFGADDTVEGVQAKLAALPVMITKTVTQKTEAQLAKEEQLNKLQDQALKLQGLQQDRLEKALRGELPTSQALLQQKDKDFSVLKEDAGRNGNIILGDSLDNAVAKTTSGQQALESLKKTYALAQDAEQRGIISGEAALPGTYAGLYGASYQNGSPGAPQGGSYSGLIPMYGQAMQPYQFNRSGQLSASSANATNRTNMITGLISTGVKGAAMAYTGGAG